MPTAIRISRSLALGWATLGAALGYSAAIALPRLLHLGMASRIALLAVAFAALLWFTVAEVRLSRTLDELERRVQFEALAIAFPASILLLILLGFAKLAGSSIGKLDYLEVWPIALLFYGIAVVFVRRRYQ